jgi:hypothetical protein
VGLSEFNCLQANATHVNITKLSNIPLRSSGARTRPAPAVVVVAVTAVASTLAA